MSPVDLTWVGLTKAETATINEALDVVRTVAPGRAGEVEAVAKRLEAAAPPAITIGVYGGLVQWVKGNPFPIRIIDYDGDDDDLPDRDEEGLLCSIWNEPSDPDLLQASV